MATSMDNLVICPDGTKFWILKLGTLEADVSWAKLGGSVSSRSNPNPTNERRKMIMYGILIQHPTDGLILWETGGGRDYPELAGEPINDIFAKVDERPEEDLERQIQACGFQLRDVSMVIMGHMHLDHAGGLLLFKETGVPIVVHELELKNAFYSVAAKTDLGVYMPYYLTFDFNWKPWYGDSYEVAQGIVLRHMPGHTPGLAIMQVNLKDSGTWIATTDMYIVKENYEDNVPLGFLARAHQPWCESNQKIHALQKRTNGKMLFGHDTETVEQYSLAPKAHT